MEGQHWGITIIKMLKAAGLLLFVFLFCCNVTVHRTGLKKKTFDSRTAKKPNFIKPIQTAF